MIIDVGKIALIIMIMTTLEQFIQSKNKLHTTKTNYCLEEAISKKAMDTDYEVIDRPTTQVKIQKAYQLMRNEQDGGFKGILEFFIHILNFFGTAIKDLLNQTFDTFQYILSHKKELYLTNKGYQLDYADMENPEIRQLRKRLYRHRYSSGLIALVYQLYGLVHATTVVIISTTIVLQMLLFKCNDTNKLVRFINSPWQLYFGFLSLLLLSFIL